MTLRELAESKGLTITTDDVLYFDNRSLAHNFMYDAMKLGINVGMKTSEDRSGAIYAVEEINKEDD